MRLLFISNKLFPCFDGIGDYTYHLAKAFANDGAEVHVLCSRDEKILNYDYKSKNTEGSSVQVHSVIESWNIWNLLAIFSQIRRISPDRIIFQYNPYGYNHFGMPLFIPLLYLLISIWRIPISTTFHEIAIRYRGLNLKVVLVGTVQRILANVCHALSSHSITSIELYSEYIYWNKKKLGLVPVGCNIDDGKKPASLEKQKIPTLSYFGSNPRGIFAAPYILNILREQGWEYQFLIVGKLKKSFEEKIKELAKFYNVSSLIKFTGYLSSQEAMKQLRETNIYLGLLDDTGITLKSGSVAAAFCAGLPVVATYGDMTDISFFKHGDNCILVENNPEEIAREIIKLSLDSRKLEHLSQAARASYINQMAWPALVNQYNEHFSTPT